MNRDQRRDAAQRGVAKALLSLDNDAARAFLSGKPPYRIVPKRDFGNQPFLINGKWVSSGFVVIYTKAHPTMGRYAGCNAMPGATWFQTIRRALIAIDCLER